VDTFVATIFSGSIADSFLHNDDVELRELVILYKAACEQDSFQLSSIKTSRSATLCLRELSTYLQGRKFFIARTGLVGLCPAWAAEGDVIVVALGCESLLVLHPTQNSCFHVGGECFVNAMMNGEGLLGSLGPGSRHEPKWRHGEWVPVVIKNDGTATQLDPRAGPLPPGWSVVYRSKYGEASPEIVDGEFQAQYFRNSDTGEEVWWDPRLTSENLKKRGVDMQEFVLV